jgi:hypothetical protein
MNDAKLDEAALQVVALGMDVEAFLQGPLGRYLVQRAETERTAALELLAKIDAEDAKAIRHCQQRIAVVDSIQQWLADAITEGRNAEQQLYEQQE